MKIHDFKRKKDQQAKISMLTCYDYPSACVVAESPIDCVLVGDSVAMVVHGHDSTVMATIEMMVVHTAAVARGLGKQFLVTDLPFLAHRISISQTVTQVRQLIQAGAHAVKIEGADPDVCQTIHYLAQSGIPVMGHIGLTPQYVHQLGGHRVQGKMQEDAIKLINQAKDLQTAGCFALVIECVPAQVAKEITQTLEIPTIGIGAGIDTDGQILVWHDVLGLQTELKPRFVKQFIEGKSLMQQAVNEYAKAVELTQFPAPSHAF